MLCCQDCWCNGALCTLLLFLTVLFSNMAQASDEASASLRVTQILAYHDQRAARNCSAADVKLLQHQYPYQPHHSPFSCFAGLPYPLGPSIHRGPDGDGIYPTFEIKLDRIVNKTGNIWHVFIIGLDYTRYSYGYRVDSQPYVNLDPYSRLLRTHSRFGDRATASRLQMGVVHRCIIQPELAPFPWQNVPKPRYQKSDLIIYEMHVRGFTAHSSSRTQFPGTYLGVVEKIAYLRALGVNCVELLPVFEFNELANHRRNPDTGERLLNYWGYAPCTFMAPMARYATAEGNAVTEFKTMVRELHRAGIAVVLDVVYNHTGGVSLSNLAPDTYYILDKRGKDTNFSGCGNTCDASQDVMMDYVLDSLRYWCTEMQVDGFRFDEGSILARSGALKGAPLDVAPVLLRISHDPVLKDALLIAEVWDAGGLCMDTKFARDYGFSEWNGRFRDHVRSFVKGTDHAVGDFARRLSGSADMFPSGPSYSVNYVTCHDGFSLYDLVSFNSKHNLPNGEGNKDGIDHNLSWNCGVEGYTRDPHVNALRHRQVRNLLVALLLSRGVPLLLMGDEYGHSKAGNNNAYCQDNPLNWFRWDVIQNNPFAAALLRFVCRLVRLRRDSPLLCLDRGFTDRDVIWHGVHPHKPDWSPESRLCAFTVHYKHCEFFFVAFNSAHTPVAVHVPHECAYRTMIDTAAPSPLDFVDEAERRPTPSVLHMQPYSCVVLHGRRG